MKRNRNLLIATFAILASISTAQAQKFAYVDTDYVLLHLQEYADAQSELNQLAIDWQVEIETKIQSIERLELSYRAERVLLTAEMRAKREEEISTKRLEARELQK
jgi:outer membrane protein